MILVSYSRFGGPKYNARHHCLYSHINAYIGQYEAFEGMLQATLRSPEDGSPVKDAHGLAFGLLDSAPETP